MMEYPQVGFGMNDALELLGHCVICRVKTVEKENLPEVGYNGILPVIRANLSESYLPVFNQLWPWLQRDIPFAKKEQGGGGGDRGGFGGDSLAGGGDKLWFTKLPTLCQPCATRLIYLQQLISATNDQILDLRRTITESKAGGRNSELGEAFKRALFCSTVEEDRIVNTVQILDELGCSQKEIEDLGLQKTDLGPRIDEKETSQETGIPFGFQDIEVTEVPTSLATTCNPPRMDQVGVQTPTPSKKFACGTCGKLFVKQAFLHDHSSVHTGEKPFKCQECGMCFRVVRGLNSHMKRHKNKALGLTPNGSIEKRRISVKSTWKPSAIVQSTSSAVAKKINSPKNKVKVTQRKRKVTKSYFKQFTCLFCEKVITRKQRFEEHMWGHTRERPYECKDCQKSFRTCNEVWAHSKRCPSRVTSGSISK